MCARKRSATFMVGLDLPFFQSCHCPHFALMTARKNLCGLIPRSAQYRSMSEMSFSMKRSMGYKYPVAQGSIYAITCGDDEGIFPPMENTFRSALLRAMDKSGRTLRNIALASNVSYEQLKNLKQGKALTTNVDDAIRVARAFGVSVEDFLSGNIADGATLVAVAGRVGAGAQVDLVDAYGKGDGLYHVNCPPQLSPNGIVAVEVEGDSMAPIYTPGTVLFYTRDALGVPTEAIGRICVCECSEGKAWVKVVRNGSQEGTFSLISVNPEAAHMHGVKLKWAAPVRFDLPPEFVKRVE